MSSTVWRVVMMVEGGRDEEERWGRRRCAMCGVRVSENSSLVN